ncbi:helix-turn-helix domain-containing protein [Saccharopolyspora sp. NPDC050389]|uniref:helix-turn-helix domain-containing protein n=1 Tax=Saccharopolyspora sp. NPDC050389 TaxID=3155516 RepID=UPI0033D34B28
MTHDGIVFDRCVRVIEYAARINNVAEACRVFGISGKTYYEWVQKAEQYGLSRCCPRNAGRPHQPNAVRRSAWRAMCVRGSRLVRFLDGAGQSRDGGEERPRRGPQRPTLELARARRIRGSAGCRDGAVAGASGPVSLAGFLQSAISRPLFSAKTPNRRLDPPRQPRR